MCRIMEEVWNEGYERGYKLGLQEGIQERVHLSAIRSITETLRLTAVQAMDALGIPQEEREWLTSQL